MSDRTFDSHACKPLDDLIGTVQNGLSEKGLPGGDIFASAIRDTLDRTIHLEDDGTTFVITGDIPAMWLRDSACQIRPYLAIAGEDPALQSMIEGLIRRQAACVLIDPYANAFNETANGNCWAHDKTDMKPELWERKYEIDSLCYALQLPYLYWKNTGITRQFDDTFLAAAKTILYVFRTEQDHENKSPYSFEREGSVFTDTLSRGGKGALVKSSTGLIWSGFRPSDDACVYGYLIPSNMFASVVLAGLSEIADVIYHDKTLAAEARSFSEEIRSAVTKYALLHTADSQDLFYAYEVDGYGQYFVADDANLPSLLAMPWFGYCAPDDPYYRNTRKVVLSDMNPYFYEGAQLRGIGSPHTPPRYVWHIALGMQGLTADDPEEKAEMLRRMALSDAGTGCMHEGVNVDDPSQFTRSWFSWANSVFCELAMDICGIRIRVTN